MALTDPCKAREPKVIDNELIKKCIDYQYPKGELGRLMREEGIPMEEIKEIRFEFMNIIKLDHLWVLKSLTKLQLNNNYIEKIENIETLVHLKELDLSFNRISKIENLENLVDLEKLSFFENLIEVLENMEQLKKLTIFNVGRNKIADKHSVLYLRRFKNLVSLNMADNPCSEEEDFRLYIAAFISQITYYEYRKIEPFEREEGLLTFEKSIENLAKIEEEDYAQIIQKEKEREDAEKHADSFVEYLNSRYLFDKMFENDDEGAAFLHMGEDVEEFHNEFETQFIDLCKQVFDVGQKHYNVRKDEVDQFFKTTIAVKEANQAESIGHMEAFLDEKTETFNQIKKLQAALENGEIDENEYNIQVGQFSDTFNASIHETWKKLMKLELQLFEQMEEVNQTVEQNLNDMINQFIEESQAVFAQIRSLEVTYMDNISDAANRYLTAVNVGEEEIPEILQKVMCDKEALNNALGSSHDIHLQVIDSREDTLINRAKRWTDNFSTKLVKDEISRHRYKLLEVNHFLDIQREEFEHTAEDQFARTKSEDLDIY